MRLLGSIAAILILSACNGGAQPPDALSRLKHDGHVACEPSVPFFCANLHVSCAGRTAVPTFAFSLRATPAGAALDAGPHARAFVEQFAGGNVEWGSEG